MKSATALSDVVFPDAVPADERAGFIVLDAIQK